MEPTHTYNIKCDVCGQEIIAVQKGDEIESEIILKYIVKKAHTENTYDSYTVHIDKFPVTIKINVDILNNKPCVFYEGEWVCIK